MAEKTRKIILCSCYSEGISAEWDHELGLILSLWHMCNMRNRQHSRLWHILQILRHGDPSAREIILDLQSTEEFVKELLDIVEQWRSRKD